MKQKITSERLSVLNKCKSTCNTDGSKRAEILQCPGMTLHCNSHLWVYFYYHSLLFSTSPAGAGSFIVLDCEYIRMSKSLLSKLTDKTLYFLTWELFGIIGEWHRGDSVPHAPTIHQSKAFSQKPVWKRSQTLESGKQGLGCRRHGCV